MSIRACLLASAMAVGVFASGSTIIIAAPYPSLPSMRARSR